LQDLQKHRFLLVKGRGRAENKGRSIDIRPEKHARGQDRNERADVDPGTTDQGVSGENMDNTQKALHRQDASAWLIRKFIDRKASFTFMDESKLKSSGEGTVSFDVSGGDFTHRGDLCTLKSWSSPSPQDIIVKRLPRSFMSLISKTTDTGPLMPKVLESVLAGIRKTAKDDADALEKGNGSI